MFWKPSKVKLSKFHTDPSKKSTFAPKRNLIIKEEVERLLKAKMIKDVKFPRWLAKLVVVEKKNWKLRVCVDFMDLTKLCPKDPFPLPHT